jgi:hypothetical protein
VSVNKSISGPNKACNSWYHQRKANFKLKLQYSDSKVTHFLCFRYLAIGIVSAFFVANVIKTHPAAVVTYWLDVSPCYIFFLLVFWGGVRLSPLGTSATISSIIPAPDDDDDDDEYKVVGGMRTGKGSRNTLRKPAPVPLCPPQIPHNLTWDRTGVVAVGSQRLPEI